MGTEAVSLEAALESLVPKDRPQGCKTCKWLDGQSEKVRQFVHEWIVEQFSDTQLHNTLCEYGYPLSISAWKLHRNHVLRDQSDES